MLDRTIAPKAQPIDNINFKMPEKWQLNNGIPAYFYDFDSQDVVKVEFLFKAGTKYQPKPLVASCVKNLMNEGTKRFTSKEIADGIDFYGAFLETELDNDKASVSVYSLNKHLDNVLPIVIDVLLNPTFPQKEIDNYLKRSRQKFLLGQEKVATLSSQAYIKNIFRGSQYGQVAVIEDYDNITQEDLINYHQTHYNPANMEIFIAGKVEDNLLTLLNHYLGDLNGHKTQTDFDFNVPNFTPSKDFVLKKGAIQSAIRYGKPTIKIDHKDFIPFQMLNTVLGGYFGSRLMMNIREDKGYTYGIGSGISSKEEIGNFIISTEVGSDVTHKAIKEIDYEIARLKQDLIPADELNIVKNYILGSLLKNTDGPFDLLDRFKTIHFNNLPVNHYSYFIDTVNNTTAQELNDIAQKYLTDMSIIVAGSVDFE